MPSPFPGMDPYLESNLYWAGFHANLYGRILTALNRSLPDGYFADIEEYVWLQGDDGWLVPRALNGHDERERADVLARRYPARTFPSGRVVVLTPEQVLEIDASPLDRAASYALAPLDADGRAGAIVAALPPEGRYGERELRLLGGLADQAKLAITSANTYEGLERTFVSTVEALANALEANDEYTSTHARWITDLSIRVGGELGLDEHALKRLELGALLHDIGKIGIPTTILSKPGRLTAEEREVVQKHPVLGERIIAPIDRLQDVRPIVRHCHERWDGRGYPDGIAGDEIPLESRIIFVCDAYHAMTTDRPYRRRLGHPEAVRRLREAAGSQFDPVVVEVCIRALADRR